MTDASERREQLRHLNDSLVSGSLSRREYDELLPFIASPSDANRQAASSPQSAAFDAALADAHTRDPHDDHYPEDADTLPYNGRSGRATECTAVAQVTEIPMPTPAPVPARGLQLRCPACGTCNDTLRGPRCEVCNSRLTIGDEFSAGRRANVPVVSALPPVVRPTGTFYAGDDGRVVIHDGFFSCSVQGTQTLATADGSTCEVFVLCCHWQSRSFPEQEATWYVSQRFSQFERLHKALKRKLSRSTATLPPFPAKYHFSDRLEKRKLGLATYLPRLLEMCAHLPNGQPAPELDEFLDVSHQVNLFRAQRPSVPAVPASVGPDVSRPSAASTSTAATSTSSPFPAFAGAANPPPTRAEASPLDETELAQAEGAVRLLADAVRRARGDVREDGTVQHHLDVCVQLAPALQRSTDLDNPFANAELIPRAMQCQEDLQQAVALYNDALLAVSEVAPRGHVRFEEQAQQIPLPEQQPLPHLQAQVPTRNIVPASAA